MLRATSSAGRITRLLRQAEQSSSALYHGRYFASHTLSAGGVSWKVAALTGTSASGDNVRVLEPQPAWWMRERDGDRHGAVSGHIVDKNGDLYNPDINWALNGMGISPLPGTVTTRNSDVKTTTALNASADRGTKPVAWKFVPVGSSNTHADLEYVDWHERAAASSGTPYTKSDVGGFPDPFIPKDFEPASADRFGSLLKRTREAFGLAEDGIHIRDISIGTGRHDSVNLRVISDSSEVDAFFNNIGVRVSAGADPRLFRHEIELIVSQDVTGTLSQKRQAKYGLSAEKDTIFFHYDKRRAVAVGKPSFSDLQAAVAHLAATAIVARGGLPIPCHTFVTPSDETIAVFGSGDAVTSAADGTNNHVVSDRGISSFWGGYTVAEGTTSRHPSANVFNSPSIFVFATDSGEAVSKISPKDAHAAYLEFTAKNSSGLGLDRAPSADRFVEHLEESGATVYNVNLANKSSAEVADIINGLKK